MVAHFRDVVQDTAGNRIPVATVDFLDPNTGLRIADATFSDEALTVPLVLPITTTDGKVEAYIAAGRRVKVRATYNGIVHDEVRDFVNATEFTATGIMPITLDLRNAATPMQERIYNTYTDDGNFERAEFKWVSNVFHITGAKLGTGLTRNLVIDGFGLVQVQLGTSGIFKITDINGSWGMDINGNWTPDVDLSFSLGTPLLRISNTYAVTTNCNNLTPMSGDKVTLLKHIGSSGSAPTAAALSGDGTSPPAPVVTTGATDVRGNITFGSGSAPGTNADRIQVTFNAVYAGAPYVILTAANAAAAQNLGQIAVTNVTNGAFNIFTTAIGISQPNTTYSVNYWVIG